MFNEIKEIFTINKIGIKLIEQNLKQKVSSQYILYYIDCNELILGIIDSRRGNVGNYYVSAKLGNNLVLRDSFIKN